MAALDGRVTSMESAAKNPSFDELTADTVNVAHAVNVRGYDITKAKIEEWDAKQGAISDLGTIRSNASTAYG